MIFDRYWKENGRQQKKMNKETLELLKCIIEKLFRTLRNLFQRSMHRKIQHLILDQVTKTLNPWKKKTKKNIPKNY